MRNLFSPTTEEELSKCKLLGNKKICTRTTPEYTIKNPDSCEAMILREPGDISDTICQALVINLLKSLWIQLRTGNSWIVTSPKPESLHVLCDDREIREITLNGTNKITISADCLGQTDHVIVRPTINLKANHTTDFMVNKTIRIQRLEEILKNYSVTLADLPLNTLGRPTDIDLSGLKVLGQTLEDIDKQAAEIGSHKRKTTILQTAYNYLQYLGYICMGIVGFLLAWKLNFCSCIYIVLANLLGRAFLPCVNIYNNCFHNNSGLRAAYGANYSPEEVATFRDAELMRIPVPTLPPNRRRPSLYRV